MKKVLFFALMAAAVLGCKRSPEVAPDPEPDGAQVIALTSGNVVISKADPVANEGEREAFMVGDQIGIFAAYPTTGGSGDPAPDWTEAEAVQDVFTGTYFANRPAKCTTAGGAWTEDTDTPGTWVPGTAALFTWGVDGTGGTANIQTYPKQDKEVFIYAYYPYDATTECPAIDALVLTDGPKWAITLNTDRTKQADLLYAVGVSKATQPAKTVKRTDPLASLSFEHALAQIDFKLYKDASSTVANCKFLSLEFVCPSKGSMTLMDGKIKLETTGDDITETYTIKDARGEELTAGKSSAISALGDTKLLMVFPMTTDELAKCTLKLKLYYSEVPVEEADPTKDVKEFTIKLDASALEAIAQGKKNTIYLGVTTTEIILDGTVAQWKDNPNSSDLVVE